MQEQIVAFYQQGNYVEANNVVKEYIDKNQMTLDARTAQGAYLLYAETFGMQRSYKEATEVLREAIDKYDSDLEEYLEAQYKQYSKSLSKPRLSIDPWPQDQKSCEAHQGVWIPPMAGIRMDKARQCNLPTTDAGKECSDSTECQGGCVVDKRVVLGTKTFGKCSERLTYDAYGCTFSVEDGVAQGGVCW